MKTQRMILTAFAILAVAFFPGIPAHAQENPGMPHIQNLKLETRQVSGTLDATMQTLIGQAEKPEWVGYVVDRIPGEHSACCSNYNNGEGCGTCHLEKDDRYNIGKTAGSSTVALEGSRKLVVLYRLDEKRVTKIRVASEECTLDAGGLTFIWLNGLKPAESVALLERFVHTGDFQDHSGRDINHGALMALALHADGSADRAMDSLVAPDQPEELRKQAAFWMGAARGKAGFSTLQRMAKSDPSSEIRAHVAFAFFVSHEAGAVDEMIRMAHDDTSSHVRGQALFWLAQKAGKKAAETITGALENDPDTEVKKKAVFALSQLPKDEGVPKLIEVAQNNRNREVRKQAMFWLGQSNDPRALQFFEKVLSQ